MKAVVFLNMGGARSKEELKLFLLNMFKDKNILTIKSEFVRIVVANLITFFRVDSAWENYEKIGGSPLYSITKKFCDKVATLLKDEYFVTFAFRYTTPFSDVAISRLKEKNIKDIILFPLYPQYSTTTVKSSLDDFIDKIDKNFNIKIIKPFYHNRLYNKAIINSIKQLNILYPKFNLIFSAHSLPKKIINSGDRYEYDIKEHIKILSKMLKEEGVNFNNIDLAYQSKIGPVEWLEPNLHDVLKKYKNKNIIIYPISFVADNSETLFELDIEYKKIAKDIGVSDYRVVRCLNYNDDFCEAVGQMIRWN